MTSIYVTVPKTEEKHFIKDKKEALEKGRFTSCFWKIGRLPRKLEVDDEIHFVYQGHLQYFAKVVLIDYSKKFCRVWFNKIEENADPMAIKSFRGFRYFRDKRL